MMIDTWILLGILPALLIVLAGLLLQHGREDEVAARRFRYFVASVTALLLLILLITAWIAGTGGNRSFTRLVFLLAAPLTGMMALLLLNARRLAGPGRWRQFAVGVLLLGLLGGMVATWGSRFDLAYLVLPGVLILAGAWMLGRGNGRWLLFLSLLCLGFLWSFNWIYTFLDTLQPPAGAAQILFFGLVFVILFVLPGLSVALAAVLLTRWLQQPGHPWTRPAGWLRPLLALLLVGGLAYAALWASIWDQTSDGILGGAISRLGSVAAIAAGMLMLFALSGRRRLVGLLFMAAAPLFLSPMTRIGWDISYHEMTERRAARIEAALADYYARENRYPAQLDDLVPRDLLVIQQPVILAGEDWCYQGGADFYRLGAFYREFFSSPVSLRTYAAVGEPDAPWACEARIAEMKDRYYSPMTDPVAMQPPTPEPLPDSEVGIAMETLLPVATGPVSVGGWSPDSAYFLFGRQEAAGALTLHFLRAADGEVCEAAGLWTLKLRSDLRDHHGWLPDGRLLFLDASGALVVLTPCADDADAGEDLSARLGETFTQIAAVDEENGRFLLKSDAVYWRLDSNGWQLRLIEGVTPNPYELHWDNYAWGPDGDRLAISRLNGRGGDEGSTLHIVDGAAGNVGTSAPLDYASEQSAPRVEWLSDREVLLRSAGVLAVLDLSATPPAVRHVLPDLFGLDLSYPYQLLADASLVDRNGRGYYLAVRADHPRNQAVYVYQSATEAVDVYEPEGHALLLFPDGQLVEMPNWEEGPSYEDMYQLIRVGASGPAETLTITGHTPREHPHLSLKYLAESERLIVASSQGISLLSFPDGALEAHWELAGGGFTPWLVLSPDGRDVVAFRDQGGLYWVPVGGGT